MILFIESPGTTIGKRSETITIYKENKLVRSISIREIEGLVITTKAHLSYDALMLLSEYSIPIIYQKGGYIASYIIPYANHGFVYTRRAQLGAYHDERGVHVAKQIVRGTLENKARLLKYYGKMQRKNNTQLSDELDKSAEEIRNIIGQVQNLQPTQNDLSEISKSKPKDGISPIDLIRQDLLGYEGEGARIYFKMIERLVPEIFGFSGRNRRPPRDPVNAALSYGYTLLQGSILTAVAISGLEPYAGFVHSDRSGKPSLILDLIEEFRQPVVDRLLLKMINKQILKVEDFEKEQAFMNMNDNARKIFTGTLFGEINTKMQIVDGESRSFHQIMIHQARKLVSYLQGRTTSYEPYKFNY